MKAHAALWFRAMMDACLVAALLVCTTLGQAQLPNHSFGAGPPSNPYNLSDLEDIPVGSYGYCKWGVLMPPAAGGNPWLKRFTLLTAGPLGAGNTDLFLNPSLSFFSPTSIPTNSIWDTAGFITLPATIDPAAQVFRKFHFTNSLIDELTNHQLASNAQRVVVLIHGWNPDSVPDAYNAQDQLSRLASKLEVALANTGWSLVVYRWEKDSDTGAVTWTQPAQAVLAAESGSEAAENGHQHGMHLGQLLLAQCPQLQKAHFIAHSAGSWVARSAMLRVLVAKGGSALSQLTLLDPFVPGELNVVDFGNVSHLTTERMNSISTWTSGIYRLENYYSAYDLPGTEPNFAWRQNVDLGAQQVHWVTPSPTKPYYGSHSGPIEFFADTIPFPADIADPVALSPFDLSLLGWSMSMAQREPVISSLLPASVSLPVGEGFSLSCAVSRRGSTSTPLESNLAIGTLNYVSFQWEESTPTFPAWTPVRSDNTSAKTKNLTIPNVTAVMNGTKYRFVVRTAAGTDVSSVSTLQVTQTIPPSPPSVPGSLVGTAVSTSQINLSWADSNTEDVFQIERKTGAGGTWSQISSVLANITSYPDFSVSAGTNYFYRVRAMNGAGSSDYSSEVSVTTPSSNSTLRALTLTSSPGGVSVTASPSPAGGFTAGVGSYQDGTTVTLTAPANFGSQVFVRWEKNGAQWATSTSTSISMDQAITMNMVYGTSAPGAVVTPSISPNGGAFTDSVSISVSSTTPDARIHYTLDGNEPSELSTQVSGTIYLNYAATLKAKAFRLGLTPSATAVATFTANLTSTVATPTFTPSGGSFANGQFVGMQTTTAGASIYFTVDGSTPTQVPGQLYSTPFFLNSSTTVKARAFKTGLNPSGLGSAAFTFPSNTDNNNFANRIRITGSWNATTGQNGTANKEGGEPRIYRNDKPGDPTGQAGGKSVWWVWRAPYSGSVTFDTNGSPYVFFPSNSNFDTMLGVFTGSSVGSLTVIGGDDDSGGGPANSLYTFNAVAGTDYNIVVDGWGNPAASGTIVLEWKMAAPTSPVAPDPPGNWNPANGATNSPRHAILAANAFLDANSDTHSVSQWQVMKASDSSILYDSGESMDKVQHTVPISLPPSTQCLFQVRFKDSTGLWSDYSTQTSFTTRSAVSATVSISQPAGASITTASPAIDVSGTASSTYSISKVHWQNEQGQSGVATGAESWSATAIPLHTGINTLQFTAFDVDDNQAQTMISVDYRPVDSQLPSVAITFPTTASQATTPNGAFTLSGTASDNQGLQHVRWVNDRGGQGTAIGLTVWNVGSIQLHPGVNNLTVTATDTDGNTQSASLSVSFAPIAPSTFLAWQSQRFTPAELASPIAAASAAADGDGIPNLIKYALGIPSGPGGAVYMPQPVTAAENGVGYLALKFRRLIGITGLSYSVSTSDDLLNWDDTGSSLSLVGSPVPTGDGVTEEVTVRVSQPAIESTRKFLRLRVTTLP